MTERQSAIYISDILAELQYYGCTSRAAAGSAQLINSTCSSQHSPTDVARSMHKAQNRKSHVIGEDVISRDY